MGDAAAEQVAGELLDDVGSVKGDATDRGIMNRHDRPVFQSARESASWTSVFRAGGASFGLPPGNERNLDGQVPEIASDGLERSFDSFVASFRVPGEDFDRGLDPLEPLLVPTFGAFSEVRENRDDDRRGSEDDADDSDPFLAGHDRSLARRDANAPRVSLQGTTPRSIRLSRRRSTKCRLTTARLDGLGKRERHVSAGLHPARRTVNHGGAVNADRPGRAAPPQRKVDREHGRWQDQ